MKRRQLLTSMAAPLVGCGVDEMLAPSGPEVFLHGVASGDPLPDAVILWTRVHTDEPAVEVRWQIARDQALSDVVGEGEAVADAARDHTVKIDVSDLEPATTYYFAFDALGERSVIGRTRTAPARDVSAVRIAVCSCSNYAYGHFVAYRHLAARDVDLVVHLGDYIYEYGDGGYGDLRPLDPPHEIVTLDDYRRRYAINRRDPDLQELHRVHPMVAVWDDHESANNSFTDGAENHNEGEGPWDARLGAAWQAYLEWMPIREQPDMRLWRRIPLGDLADLIMLDTRIWGRDRQLGDDHPDFADPERTLLGEDQEAWLIAALSESQAVWKIIGQQVMFGRLPQFANEDAWDGYPAARDRIYDAIEEQGVEDVVVLTGDVHSSWAMDLPRDPFGGYDPETGSGSLGVELVVSGITSPGFPPELAPVAEGFVIDNPHMQYAELVSNGYLVVDVDAERIEATYYYVDDVSTRSGPEREGGVLRCDRGSRHLVRVS